LIDTLKGADIDYLYRASLKIETNLNGSVIQYLACTTCALRFFFPLITGDVRFYEQLKPFSWYYMTDKPEFRMAAGLIPKSGRVLEVGAGQGAFAEWVGKDRYVGLEYNGAAIEEAGRRGIPLLKEAIEQHAIKNAGAYDSVASFQVLEHVESPASFIKGCLKALKIGGNLLIAVPNHDGFCGMIQNSVLDVPPHHVTHWPVETLKFIATMFGLKLVSIMYEEIAPYHKEWAQKTVYERRLRKMLRIKDRLVDSSFSGRAVSRIASLAARFHPPDLNQLKGHTVVACYQKVTRLGQE
jgi:2-polyprenyl-3-methyl-5-hydroxy-6-metoxy-1,4-benzoquinol methylase